MGGTEIVSSPVHFRPPFLMGLERWSGTFSRKAWRLWFHVSEACYAANREQPQIENSNEMHDIHCAIMVFMAEGNIALAGAMNIILFEYI